MKVCAQLFVDFLKEKNFQFTVGERDGGAVEVDFPYNGKITRCIFDGENGEYLFMFIVYERVPEDKFADVLLICNELNSKYKWTTMYIDNEYDLVNKYNAILSTENAAAETMELLANMNKILENSKADIMRAIYA